MRQAPAGPEPTHTLTTAWPQLELEPPPEEKSDCEKETCPAPRRARNLASLPGLSTGFSRPDVASARGLEEGPLERLVGVPVSGAIADHRGLRARAKTYPPPALAGP